MEENKSFIVNGFDFEGPQEAKQAALEQTKIQKIEEKLDINNPEKIKMIYDKAIENNVFKTMVGYVYLKKLQGYLIEFGKKDIKPIPVVLSAKPQETAKKQRGGSKADKEKIKQYEKSIKNYRYVIMVLIALIIGMIAISLTGNRPNILNYERTVQNKYAAWEQELKERENVIRQKERELNIIVE